MCKALQKVLYLRLSRTLFTPFPHPLFFLSQQARIKVDIFFKAPLERTVFLPLLTTIGDKSMGRFRPDLTANEVHAIVSAMIQENAR